MANKWLLSSMAMMMSFSAVATPIDGWDQEAYNQNQTLLKAVIKIQTGAFFAGMTCSSTLISKNILLTAKHCVGGLAPGKRIKLNGNPQYEVVDVIQQRSLDKITGSSSDDAKKLIRTSTDVALILFKSSDCSSATLGGVQPIPLAKSANKSGLSNRVLIAGYGLTNPYGRDDSGTLRAGYNEWVVSDYSKTDPKVSKLIQTVAAAIKVPQDSLIMKGERSQVDIIANTKGQKINSDIVKGNGMDPVKGALPLPGDSGGPAIAFDSKQNPYIVGVTSMAAPKAGEPSTVILAAEPNAKEPFFSAELSEAKSIDTMMDELMSKLLELKYVAPNETVLKDFGVIRMGGRAALGTYASVLNPENDSFINSSLTALIKQRDAANYCQ